MQVDPSTSDIVLEEHETNKSNWCDWFHLLVLIEAVSVRHWIAMFSFPDFCEDIVAAMAQVVFNYAFRNSDYRFVWQLLYLSGAVFILCACCHFLLFAMQIYRRSPIRTKPTR